MREKRGNTYWVRCPKCGAWFHVAPDLLHSKKVKMQCPPCHHEFFANEAEDLVEP